MHTFHKILLPYDGSSTSQRAMDMAFKLASGSPVKVRIVHSIDELAYISGYEYSQIFSPWPVTTDRKFWMRH